MKSTRRLFLRQLGATALGAGALSALPYRLLSEPAGPLRLPRSSPEQQGISSTGILAFLDAVENSRIEFHSMMIVRHGNVVAEGWWAPYASGYKHTLYSLSKSFTSSAVGLAIGEKYFTPESPVISFFPGDLPTEVSANLKAMQVKHLLTMSTGHAKDTIPSLRNGSVSNWPRAFLEIPLEFEPGTHFLYNTGATYMLSAIVQKTTGKTLLEYLKPKLFDPLGIEDPDWEMDPRGTNVGGYGLRVRTEDIAKFGQLYLQKGMWNGKQVLPPGWVADATSAHIDSSPAVVKRPKEEDDWAQGYGYQFWRCRFGAYRGDGAFGQFCVVLPEQDTVIAITGESFDLQGSLNLVWSSLLPSIGKSALPPDKALQVKLGEKLKSLHLNPPVLNPTSVMAATISGRVFKLDDNEFLAKSFSLTLADDACIFRLTLDKTEHQVVTYVNRWYFTEKFRTQLLFPMWGRPEVPTPLAASVTWKNENTLLLTLRYVATAHSDTISFVFNSDRVTVQFLSSVSAGNPDAAEKRLPIQGMMA